MYIRVTYPKIQCFDNNGNLAAGYYIYTYNAGLSSAATTYSDRLLTVPNTNPVVLDARGEADIYTAVAIKLILTVAGGDPASPIWTEDYYGEQQNTTIISGSATSDDFNNYVFNPSPAFTVLPDPLVLILNVDKNNKDTLTGTTNRTPINVTFSGGGFNDGTFSGPYIGTTPNSVFTVQIDGTQFQGTGLNDLTWGGMSPVSGNVYTVVISTAAGTDKFQWKKNGGTLSAEVAITGAAQALSDGVTVTFAATTGHTAGDLWNCTDTFRWKKDGGAWTAGTVITAIAQTLMEGIAITFAEKNGHTLNDLWALTVMTPARLNISSLGSVLLEKNVAGTLQALDGSDMVASTPAEIVYSGGYCNLINPSLPTLTPSELIPNRIRIEISADYTMQASDKGKVIAVTGTHTITLPACSTVPHTFYYVMNKGSGTVTIQSASVTDKIYLPGSTTSVSSFALGSGKYWCVQLETNGVDWLIDTVTMAVPGSVVLTQAADGTTWTVPQNVYSVIISGTAPGGGGCIGAGGGAGKCIFKTQYSVVPGTGYLITVPAGGARNTGATGDGTDAADASIGALVVLTGGGGAVYGTPTSTGGASGGFGGQPGNAYAGGSGMFGAGGVLTAGSAGSDGAGYGAGGGPGDGVANGGNGAPAFFIIEW